MAESRSIQAPAAAHRRHVGGFLSFLQAARTAFSAVHGMRHLETYTARHVRQVRLLQMGMGALGGQGEGLFLDDRDAADDAPVCGSSALQPGYR